MSASGHVSARELLCISLTHKSQCAAMLPPVCRYMKMSLQRWCFIGPSDRNDSSEAWATYPTSKGPMVLPLANTWASNFSLAAKRFSPAVHEPCSMVEYRGSIWINDNVQHHQQHKFKSRNLQGLNAALLAGSRCAILMVDQ